MKHFLSIESLSGDRIRHLVDEGAVMKAGRGTYGATLLAGQCWSMLFAKASTRTRVSFEVGIREMGGNVMFLSGADTQLGRGEPIKDTARVMGRMVHGAIIRTFKQEDVEVFAEFSGIPTINALTDAEHPCQILADLLTIKETLGGWDDRKLVFMGDGDCNMGRSWAWAAAHLGVELVIGAPEAFQPDAAFMDTLPEGHRVRCTADPLDAVQGAHMVYTDVWVSMGKESEAADRLQVLEPYQLNETLMTEADPSAIVLHCLPAYRGKEITETLLEARAETIFQQAENRLHAQKAILKALTE